MDALHENSSPHNFLELHAITKVYTGVVALDNVSLSIVPGEVLGLIGENGAGKSTLMKVLGGVIAPSSGHIRLKGNEHSHLSVQQSLGAGIAFVHQELNLFENLSVSANVLLGREKCTGRFGLIDEKAMAQTVAPVLRRIGATFAPDTMVADLSLAQRQMLEIAKALSLNARVVIMDEPTSSLTLSETATLLKIIGELKNSGISVVYISHRLSEVEQCADRVVVLRDGEVAGNLERKNINHAAMIELMIGRKLKSFYAAPSQKPGDTILKVRKITTPANPHASVDLSIHKGEILGVAGLVGAGRTELARTLFGIDQPLSGSLEFRGKTIKLASPADAISHGIFLVPEDRKQSGLILEFDVCENITLASLNKVSNWGLVNKNRQHDAAETQRKNLSIKTPDIYALASELSGGNQQKIVLAKWLSSQPKLIIFDEPTRGIDVGARGEFYKLMRGLSDQGVAVIMISSDMEEIIGVSDRIAVMFSGAISGFLMREEFSEQNILTLAMGQNVQRN